MNELLEDLVELIASDNIDCDGCMMFNKCMKHFNRTDTSLCHDKKLLKQALIEHYHLNKD